MQAIEEKKGCVLKLKLLFSKMSHTVKWSLGPLELALGGGCLPAPPGPDTSLSSQCLWLTRPAPATLDGP